MRENHKNSPSPHLVWVSPETPIELYSVARLYVTRELRRLGWHVTLIGTGPTGRCHIHGVELLCVPRPQIYLGGQWVFHLNALRFIAREWGNIDIILFHPVSALWYLPLRLVRWASGRKRPLLIMDTRDFMDYSPGNLKHWLRRLYTKLTFWLAAYLADGQTTITRRMAQYANIPSRQLLGTWPSGVNPNSFSPARKSRQWPAPDEPIHLIYIGMLARKRNLSFLCRAVEQANAIDMRFALTLVGDGDERIDLESFSQNSSAKIRILPPVSHEQIPELLAQAHIGVTSLPAPNETKYQASSPIKLFEYMAAGLPILSTSNVCHTEVVENGNYAFWVDRADKAALLEALRRIWLCHANLAQMGAESKEAANSWTWSASAKKLSDALQRGMAGRYMATDCASGT